MKEDDQLPARPLQKATVAVHGGEPRHHPYDAITPPIVQTATYTFENTARLIDYMEGAVEREEYGRYGNPSVKLLEQKVAALDGGADAVAFGSGMAAVTTAVLALVKQGSHVVLFNDCYRRTRQFVAHFLARFGIEHSLVPAADLEALEASLRPETRLVISEAPTNPYQTVVDLEALATLCKKRRVKTMVDATFATPINLRPLDLGIDLVVHSATKYLAGHNDVLGGVLTGSHGLVSLCRDLRGVLGAVLDPHAAYLISRGLKTLGVRVAQQNEGALAVARWLEAHPKVQQVWYPGLESHPSHAVASRLMDGFGGVVTFTVAADRDSTSRVVDACALPRIAPSLGGVESLIEQPALISYFELDAAAREKIGILDNLVRYSVGVEDPNDLIADLEQALSVLA